MRSSRRMEHDMPLHRELGRKDRTSDGHRSTIEQAWEHGVFPRADLVTRALLGLYSAFGVCVLQRHNVAAIMKFDEFFDGSRFTAAEVGIGQPAEDSSDVNDGCMADDIERVIAPECRAAIDLAADEQRFRSRYARSNRAFADGRSPAADAAALEMMNLHRNSDL